MPIPSITSQHSEVESGSLAPDFKKSLRRLDHRVSWQWWNAVLVITLLMGTIVVLSLPKEFQGDDPLFQLQLTDAVRGLLGLVLIFNVYTLYQQHLLKQVRNDLAKQVEIATEQRIRAEALYELAILDPLTGLFNRRHMEDSLARELLRADRAGKPLGVILFDLDHFKRFNDNFGHEAGDYLLKELAARLTGYSRREDIACRYGGEEFLLIMPEASLETAAQRAELLRGEIKQMTWECRGRTLGRVTLSCGVAAFPQHGKLPDGLLQAADLALYQAKHGGRDRVVAAPERQ